ncbi:MAG: hypothetical protein K1X89_09015 [Myxococcaceae bacterium]|nr:hypothetical protein [Myxococcaceae bacterium]
MRAALAALGGLLLAGCGPSPHGPALPFELTISAALADTISGFQVSLVNKGSSLDCTQVQQNCLVKQVSADRFVRVQDASGVEHAAVVVPLKLVAGTPSTQNTELRNVPPGKDFALVVEALSKLSPPNLVGSSCTYVPEITAGANAAVLTQTIKPLATPVACDPRVEK